MWLYYTVLLVWGTKVVKSQPGWPQLLHRNLMCVNSYADFGTSSVFTIIHSTKDPLVSHRCICTIVSQILPSTAIHYLINTGSLQEGTQTLQKLLVTHLTKTQNFVKHDAVSVRTFCSLKVISAIENSILGHNYITSTVKKLFLQRRITEAILRLSQIKTHPNVVIIC